MSTLGDRMKDYEGVSRTRLTRRVPMLIRCDGRAFHTFTRGCMRPWDERFHACMWEAASALCEDIQGARIAYVQSDEITVLVTDADGPTTEAWFGNEVQKVASLAAARASVAFLAAWVRRGAEMPRALPVFDARCWSVPEHEVVNAFIWRQQDATRNSVAMLAQSRFSPRQLHGVSGPGMQDMLMAEHGINWNDCPTVQKRGACIFRETVPGPEGSIRHRWSVDHEIPIFTQDRDYIGRRLLPRAGTPLDPAETSDRTAGVTEPTEASLRGGDGIAPAAHPTLSEAHRRYRAGDREAVYEMTFDEKMAEFFSRTEVRVLPRQIPRSP